MKRVSAVVAALLLSLGTAASGQYTSHLTVSSQRSDSEPSGFDAALVGLIGTLGLAGLVVGVVVVLRPRDRVDVEQEEDGLAGVQPAVPLGAPALIDRGSGRVTQLRGGFLLIGRSSACALIVESPRVARKHAIITCRGTDFVIEDVVGMTGTFVNGQRCESRVLRHGDVVGIGDSEFVFVQPPARRSPSHDRQQP